MAKKTRADVTSALNVLTTTTYAETVDGQLKRIEDSKSVISAEVSYLGLGDDKNLKDSAVAIAGIESKGVVDEEIKEGETYTLEAGYYEGGTVKGVAGGGNYELEAKSATPTEEQQVITATTGKYGLSQVTIAPIPSQYKDTTNCNATADEVLVGYSAQTAAGKVEGAMANNGGVKVTLDTATSEYVPAEGYHNGKGLVSVASMTKEVVPTEADQTITGDLNKYLSSVTVKGIDKTTYLTAWTADATAAASEIFVGKTAYVNGVKVEGTMVNNATWDAADHLLTTGGKTGESAVSVPAGYHDGRGTVKIDAQDKTATAPAPGVAQQTITADAGKVLNSVIIPALDAKYQDVSAVTADAAHVCETYKFVDANGTVVQGTLADKGDLKDENFYDDLLASGSTGFTALEGTNGHYTSVKAAMDGSLYTRLSQI